jgi:hypothetical protein
VVHPAILETRFDGGAKGKVLDYTGNKLDKPDTFSSSDNVLHYYKSCIVGTMLTIRNPHITGLHKVPSELAQTPLLYRASELDQKFTTLWPLPVTLVPSLLLLVDLMS